MQTEIVVWKTEKENKRELDGCVLALMMPMPMLVLVVPTAVRGPRFAGRQPKKVT